MRWIDALKQWNSGQGKWCIPKKGTEDYDAVRAIMGPKAEKEKKVKAEKAPKEAKAPKAPKASLQDMAAAVGVPMKTMKDAAADYYKRVDNADASTRALLIERMPAQLRAGWEKHQASKEPAAPVVRRVLKKKPVMVAPEAPAAPAMKIPMEAQRKPFRDSMAPKIAMIQPKPFLRNSEQVKVERKQTDLKVARERQEDIQRNLQSSLRSALSTIKTYRDPSPADIKVLRTKPGEREVMMRQVSNIIERMPEEKIPEILLKYWRKTDDGQRHKAALEAPAPAMKSETSASDVLKTDQPQSDKQKLSKLITDLNYHHMPIQLRKNPNVYAVTVLGYPTNNKSSPTRIEFWTLTDSQIQDLKQRASALKTQYPIRFHFPSGDAYSSDVKSATGPAVPVARQVIKKS
jgi:hypothetical protein